jgi:hypothetical protein
VEIINRPSFTVNPWNEKVEDDPCREDDPWLSHHVHVLRERENSKRNVSKADFVYVSYSTLQNVWIHQAFENTMRNLLEKISMRYRQKEVIGLTLRHPVAEDRLFHCFLHELVERHRLEPRDWLFLVMPVRVLLIDSIIKTSSQCTPGMSQYPYYWELGIGVGWVLTVLINTWSISIAILDCIECRR